MAVRLKSLLTTGPVTIPLNSGNTVRLSPGQISDELHEVEVAGNAKVEKLRQRRVVEVVTDDSAPANASGEDAGTEPRTRSRK
jgi:hypothetical protein